jgi:hypothetical protein
LSKQNEKSNSQHHSHDSNENNNLVAFADPEQIVYEDSSFSRWAKFPTKSKTNMETN